MFVVEEFCKRKSLSTFGMPLYIASGSHEYNGKKYRFLVMEKFGTDIWKLFLENNRKFPAATVYQLGLQIVSLKKKPIFLCRYNKNVRFCVDSSLRIHTRKRVCAC